MANTMYPVRLILNLNDRLFLNALEGVTENQALERISDHNNPLNWLAAHTVWARYNMCKLLGNSTAQNPYLGMFESFKPFDAAVDYGTLAMAKTEWNTATGALKESLATISDDYLLEEAPFKNPTGDFTVAGGITFLAQHESYDIGQIAFLKKYFTGEAMKY